MTATTDYKKRHPTTVGDMQGLQPMFVVFTGDSIRYDDGYGDHGSASYSTREFLNAQFMYSMDELREWIKNENSGRSSIAKAYRVFALKDVQIDVQILVDIK